MPTNMFLKRTALNSSICTVFIITFVRLFSRMCPHVSNNTIRSHGRIITSIPFAFVPIQTLFLDIFTNIFDIVLDSRIGNDSTRSQMVFINMMLKFIAFYTLIRTVLIMTFVRLFTSI